jgi:minor extracellular serine protease Vpr
MKLFATVVALFAAGAASSFAGESSLHTKSKTPYYRPHPFVRNARAKPHGSSVRSAVRNHPRDVGDATIVNAASYEEGISPGALATIFGTDLTTVSGIVYADSNPLPTHLAGVDVVVSGLSAPIYGIAYANGQDQISIQVPYDAPTGAGAAEIQVYDQGDLVADFFTDSFTEDPGIFTYDDGVAIAEASDYSLIGSNNPANAGEALILFVTGLGPLNMDLVDGYGSPTSAPFAETVDPFEVIVDNEQCNVFFSGLAPGFVGLYQINFYVPDDAASGNLQIYIQDQYTNSATAILPVQ